MSRVPITATAWMAARLVVAAALVAAVLVQGATTISAGAAAGWHVPTVATNYVSFFTILSSSAAAIALAISALSRLPRARRARTESAGLAVAVVCVTTYMAITGAVYNLLLRAISIGPDTVGWANELMHVWAPLFLVADLVFGPGHRVLPWRSALVAVAFPIAWIGYTLVRAPLVRAPATGVAPWYPYPFLDPRGPDGWAGVGGYVAAIALGILAVAYGAVAVGRVRARISRRRAQIPAR